MSNHSLIKTVRDSINPHDQLRNISVLKLRNRTKIKTDLASVGRQAKTMSHKISWDIMTICSPMEKTIHIQF